MEVKFLFLDGISYDSVKEYAALLPPSRREKTERLRFDSDRLLSLAVGLMIRAEANGAELAVSESGKPYFVDSSRFFSVSHSGSCAAIAVDDVEVGIDVERMREKDITKLMDRFFHPDEARFVEASSDRTAAFTRIWTRKEAYLKMLGTGIATELSAFDTMSDDLSACIRSFGIDGYVLSVCSAKPIYDNDIYISKVELNELI